LSGDFQKILDTQENLLAYNDLAEELIGKGQPIQPILRLLCLQSLFNGGLRQMQYDYFRKEIVQPFGYEHLITLQQLDAAKLFYLQTSSRNPYPQLRKHLKLVLDDFGPADDPRDLYYTCH